MKNAKNYLVHRYETGNKCDYNFKSLVELLDFIAVSIAKGFTEFEIFAECKSKTNKSLGKIKKEKMI